MKKNKTKKALATLAIAGMAVTMVPFNAFASGVTTDRLAGSDRIGTAVQVAQKGWTTADTAILAPSADANLVDALAAAPLAGKKAPILLTDKNTLSAATQTELTTLGVKNVYVVGAISQAVVDQVNALPGVKATVLKGADRIGTAAQISAKLTAPAGSFVVGYGALADALSVASFAAANNYSILVANPDGSLPASEKAFLGSKVYIIGGPTLVADIAGATRLYGADRFATNQQVLNNLTYQYDKVYVANGTSAHLVDSLVASSLAAQANAPIVLGDTTSALAASSVHGKLAANAVVTALGGTGVVPNEVVAQVATGTVTPPPPNPTVTISNLSVSGQSVGTGDLAKPAIATINSGVTVSTTITGLANANVTFLASSSANITATANGQTVVATNLSSPTVIGNDKFNASYTVTADASGNASITFTSTAASTNSFNVVGQAPVYNGSQPIRSNESRIQWGVPGTVVISPMYGNSSSPYQLNFSSGSNGKGLVPVVATVLPAAGSTTAVSGQTVKFTLTGAQGDNVGNKATANITDASGVNQVDAGAYINYNTTAYFNATTDSNGQAVMYVNANQPTTNGAAIIGSNLEAFVQAQLVNGGGTSNQSYLDWQTNAYPSQVANISPAQSLNDATQITNAGANTDNIQTATSGSNVTFSGTLEDAAGNPVTNARLVVQDYNVANNNTSNNLTSDAFITNATDGTTATTSTLFSSTSYPILTSDANGNFSFTVTSTIPVSQQVGQSSTKYYVYYVPSTVSLANGASLQSTDVTPLTLTGNSSGFLSILWQQGDTVQAVGAGHDAPLSQYASLSAVPQNPSITRLVGSDRSLYAAAYNQNGQLVAPADNTQFDGYQLDFTVTAPVGEYFDGFDGYGFTTTGSTAGAVSVSGTNIVEPFKYVTGLKYSINNNGVLTLTALSGSNTTSSTSTSINSLAQGLTAVSGGMAQFVIQSTDESLANGTSGTINVSVAAKYVGSAYTTTAGTAKGGASATINASFVPASNVATLGVYPSVQNMAQYQPLLTGNAPLPATVSLSGTAYGSAGSASTGALNGGNATFIAGSFNTYPNLATIPTQGITYNLAGTKNSKIYSIDGVPITGAPASASVNIQNSGAVSINNVPAFPTGTVAYGIASNGTVYYLKGSASSNFTLYKLSDNSVAGTFTYSSGSYPTGSDVYYDFSINSTGTMTTISSNQGNGGTNATFTGATYTVGSALTLAPVQLLTVNSADEYAESPVITVSNSVNSQTAKVNLTYQSTTNNVGNVLASPMNISSTFGTQKNVTFTAQDQFGNPIPSMTFYIQPNLNGMWVTQVNGAIITSSVTMGTNNSSSTQNTPVPLFDTTPTVNNAAYSPDLVALSSISTGNITAWGLQSGTPVISVSTGTDGTVSLTLADGTVPYIGKNASASIGNEQAVSGGNTISGTLNIYKNTTYTPANMIGSVNVSWQN